MNFNGYRASHRNKWLLLQHKVLKPTELMLLEFYIDQMDFDGNHKNAGMFEYFPEEIALIFSKQDPGTIRKWHNGLANKGFITIADSKHHLWSVLNRDRYITNSHLKGKAHQYAKEESNCQLEKILSSTSFFPNNYEKFPPFLSINLKKKSSIATDSSKVQSITTSHTPISTAQSTKTIKDYQQIYKNEGYIYLLPEDMMWIDNQNYSPDNTA